MRVEFSYEMTDELARAGNALMVQRETRGITWYRALAWLLVALAVLAALLYLSAHWIWVALAAITATLFFLGLVLVLGLPWLHEVRLRSYLQQLAAWPHRRVTIALTPDIVELTTPRATGLMDIQELSEVLRGDGVTVLLFARKILVPIPTAVIPEAAWPLLEGERPEDQPSEAQNPPS